MNISNLVKEQRKYFMEGTTLNYPFRIKALQKLLDTIAEMEPEIITALTTDLNKSEIEACMTEIGIVQDEIRYTIKNLSRWMKRTRVKTPLMLFPAKCYAVPEPFGVVLIMSPWNYPFMLSISPLVGAIAAGNCAIIKPSAYAPIVSDIVHRLIDSCFDYVHCLVVPGSRKENTELLRQRFDYIFFTGSASVGRIVMEAASKHLCPVTLELGGKSPVIVDETADLDITAKRLVFGKYMNAGQTCIAPDYVFVHTSKKKELIEKLRHYIACFYPKDETGVIIDYPRIVNDKHFERLCALLQGEHIVVGGEYDRGRLSIEPTVLDKVSLTAPLMQEEIFGPILPIIEYECLDDAIDEIRGRPKPLALYVFSSRKTVWQRIEKTISFGGGCLNDCLIHASSPYLPFGGVGESGMGRYHGKASFETFSHYKSLINKSTKIDFALRYRPYDESKRRLLRKLW